MPDVDLYKQISGNLSLGEVLDQFLLAKDTEGLTEKTLHYYKSEIGRLVEFAHDPEILDMTPDVLRQFFKQLGETRNKGGVHATYRPIRAMFLWYEQEMDLDDWKNPIRKVQIPKPKVTAIPGVTMEDYGKLIAACERGGSTGQRDKALFYCLLIPALELRNLSISISMMPIWFLAMY